MKRPCLFSLIRKKKHENHLEQASYQLEEVVLNDAASTFSQRDSPDHRGLEVRGHGNRPALSVDLHPGVCGGNAGALHAAAVPKLQHAHCRRVGVGFYVLMISFFIKHMAWCSHMGTWHIH